MNDFDFDDNNGVLQDLKAGDEGNLIHIFLIDKKKRGKKLTRIKGLSEEYNFKKILNHFKKTYNCNGAIKKDEQTSIDIIELSGDHREAVKTFFNEEGIADLENIRIHGL